MKTADETALPLAGLLLVKVGPLLAAIATLVVAALATAEAQTQDLFIPIPQNQFSSSVTPEQSQRLARLKQQPTTKSLDLVAINLGALQSHTTKFSFSGQRAPTFSKQSVQKLGGADVTGKAVCPTSPGTATLVVRDGNITGTVQDGSNLFHIEPLGGGVHAIVKVDTSRLPPDHPPSAESNQQDAITPKENLHLQSAPRPRRQSHRYQCDRGLHPVGRGFGLRYRGHDRAGRRGSQSIRHEQRIRIRLNLVTRSSWTIRKQIHFRPSSPPSRTIPRSIKDGEPRTPISQRSSSTGRRLAARRRGSWRTRQPHSPRSITDARRLLFVRTRAWASHGGASR